MCSSKEYDFVLDQHRASVKRSGYQRGPSAVDSSIWSEANCQKDFANRSSSLWRSSERGITSRCTPGPREEGAVGVLVAQRRGSRCRPPPAHLASAPRCRRTDGRRKTPTST